MVVSRFPKAIANKSTLNERAFYGHQVTHQITENNPTGIFQIPMSGYRDAVDALLRVSFDRELDANSEISITFNGKELDAPAEDSADRYHDTNNGYASTRLIPIPKKMLRDSNSVMITFPDGREGTIGATVLRARFPK